MNPDDPLYEVPISAKIRQRLRIIQELAWDDDRESEFLSSLHSISERLKKMPLEFGEELYDLRSLRLIVKKAVLLPLSIVFAVHLERKLVFIQNITYMPRANG